MTSEPENPAQGLPLADTGVPKSGPVSHSPANARSRWLLVPLIMVSLFSGAVIGMYFQPPGLRAFFNSTGLEPGAGTDTPIAIAIQQVETQELIAVLSEGDVVALGRIIPRGDVISLATPSGAGDALIAEMRVSVGDDVEVGDIIAVLDKLPQLESAIVSAEAAVRLREAEVAQTRALIAVSRAEAQASLERAEATLTVAQSELDRVTELLDRGVTTRVLNSSRLSLQRPKPHAMWSAPKRLSHDLPRVQALPRPTSPSRRPIWMRPAPSFWLHNRI
jgi:HlyD family secretion protein